MPMYIITMRSEDIRTYKYRSILYIYDISVSSNHAHSVLVGVSEDLLPAPPDDGMRMLRHQVSSLR